MRICICSNCLYLILNVSQKKNKIVDVTISEDIYTFYVFFILLCNVVDSIIVIIILVFYWKFDTIICIHSLSKVKLKKCFS